MFKRRTPRTLLRQMTEFIWPQSGWKRAAHYVAHRLRRLPDRPERIARGIFAGVFTAFTPFYGMHFVIAALIAKLMRGNILAALLGTFFGNPLTYVPIAILALKTGEFILGEKIKDVTEQSLFKSFAGAWRDLWNNFIALFTDSTANWGNLVMFWDQVFIPYLVGGIMPGLVAGTIAYYLSLPLIVAYQNRRRTKVARKAAEILAAKQAKQADAPGGAD